MASRFSPKDRINLSGAAVLIVDSHNEGMEIITQMFAGFGVHTPQRCSTAEEAMIQLAEREFNLIVVDSHLSDTDGYEFIRGLRRSDMRPNCFAPILLLTGHTKQSEIFKGRDCGANFVVRKPVAPSVLLQRILWVAKETRAFVESATYCGPDRRFRALGPPAGERGRRHDDLSFEVGEATSPNLDQEDIDALMQPQRAVL